MKAIQYEYSIPWLTISTTARVLRLGGLTEYGY
jgi:hypothetical protein